MCYKAAALDDQHVTLDIKGGKMHMLLADAAKGPSSAGKVHLVLYVPPIYSTAFRGFS